MRRPCRSHPVCRQEWRSAVVEVGRGHTRRIGRRRGDRAEREVLVAVVLVPRDLVVIPRRAEHVESPSPSTSAANTLRAKSAPVVTVF